MTLRNIIGATYGPQWGTHEGTAKGENLMTTMNDLYGDDGNPEGNHKVCPNCGWCLVCDACMCDYLKENPDMEGLRFPYQKEEKTP